MQTVHFVLPFPGLLAQVFPYGNIQIVPYPDGVTWAIQIYRIISGIYEANYSSNCISCSFDLPESSWQIILQAAFITFLSTGIYTVNHASGCISSFKNRFQVLEPWPVKILSTFIINQSGSVWKMLKLTRTLKAFLKT